MPGAVLLPIDPDGSERPVAFASRTLMPAGRNYSQFEREALAMIFGRQDGQGMLTRRSQSSITLRRSYRYKGMQLAGNTSHCPRLPEESYTARAPSRPSRHGQNEGAGPFVRVAATNRWSYRNWVKE